MLALALGACSSGAESPDAAGGTSSGGGSGDGGSSDGASGSATSGSSGTDGNGGSAGTAGQSSGGTAPQGGGTAGVGGTSGSGGGGGAAGRELRVTSSNIRYGTADDGDKAWPLRKALLFQVLKAQAFDSAGLQEALQAQLEELDVALPEYGRVGVGRDDGEEKGEFSPILYAKERYEVASSGTFWLSDTPELPGSKTWGNTLPRICSWARLKHKACGRHYWHYNVHLDHLSQPSREKSAQLVAQRMAARAEQSEPVILTGDFNAEPGNLAVTYLVGGQSIEAQKSPVALTDAWLTLHEGDAASGTFHSFNGGTDGIHIDYVMFGRGVSAKSAAIVTTHDGALYPSDHYPVSAVLTLEP